MPHMTPGEWLLVAGSIGCFRRGGSAIGLARGGSLGRLVNVKVVRDTQVGTFRVLWTAGAWTQRWWPKCVKLHASRLSARSCAMLEGYRQIILNRND